MKWTIRPYRASSVGEALSGDLDLKWEAYGIIEGYGPVSLAFHTYKEAKAECDKRDDLA